MTKLSVNTPAGSTSPMTEFCDLADKLREILAHFKIQTPPRAANSLNKFKTLDEASQQTIVQELKVYVDLCAEARDEGIDATDSHHSLAWWFLKKFGLRPTSDVFSHVNATDIVEVYTFANRQIYRSFNMFQYLTYTIEEVLTHSWPELFRREQEMTDGFLDIVRKIASGETRTPVILNTPPHPIEEIFSAGRRREIVSEGMVAPLFDQSNKPAAMLTTLRMLGPAVQRR